MVETSSVEGIFTTAPALVTDGSNCRCSCMSSPVSRDEELTSRDQDDADLVSLDVGPSIGAELGRRAAASRCSVSELARRVLLQWISQTSNLTTGILRVDPVRRTATIAARTVRLSPLETKVLVALLKEPGRAVTTNDMAILVWGSDTDISKGALAVHISRLRDKLGPAVGIHPVRGLGYLLELT